MAQQGDYTEGVGWSIMGQERDSHLSKLHFFRLGGFLGFLLCLVEKSNGAEAASLISFMSDWGHCSEMMHKNLRFKNSEKNAYMMKYSAVSKDEIMSFVDKWVNLEVRKSGQTPNDPACIWVVKKKVGLYQIPKDNGKAKSV